MVIRYTVPRIHRTYRAYLTADSIRQWCGRRKNRRLSFHLRCPSCLPWRLMVVAKCHNLSGSDLCIRAQVPAKTKEAFAHASISSSNCRKRSDSSWLSCGSSRRKSNRASSRGHHRATSVSLARSNSLFLAQRNNRGRVALRYPIRLFSPTAHKVFHYFKSFFRCTDKFRILINAGESGHRKYRSKTPEILLSPHHLEHSRVTYYDYCDPRWRNGPSYHPQGSVESGTAQWDRTYTVTSVSSKSGGGGGGVIYKSYRNPSDIDSQISLPRSYTLPREFKYKKPKSRKAIRTEHFIHSTNSSDGNL